MPEPSAKTIFAQTLIREAIEAKGWELAAPRPGSRNQALWRKVAGEKILDESSREFRQDAEAAEAEVRAKHPGDFWHGSGGGIAPF